MILVLLGFKLEAETPPTFYQILSRRRLLRNSMQNTIHVTLIYVD